MANYRSRTFKNPDSGRGLVRRCTDCGEAKPLDSTNFGVMKNDQYGFARRCRPCTKKFNHQRYEKIKGRVPEQKQERRQQPEKKKVGVEVTCSCGHNWTYNVERPSMLDYLRGKPCPPCGMEKERKTEQSPEQREQDEKKREAERKETEKREAERIKKIEEAREARIDRAWVDRIINMLPTGEVFHNVLVELLMALDAGLTIWLQGPPGTSKSTLVEQAARGIKFDFYPMSCHEYMTESKLFGFIDAGGKEHRTPFWDAFEKGGVLLLDEIDNGNPNLLAALNSALSNGHCVFAGTHIIKRHPDFRVVATANTAGLGPEHGFIGRNGVDLATRDRFITLDVPIDPVLESALAAMHMGEDLTEELVDKMFMQKAKDKLEERSINREDDITSDQIVDAVKKMRTAVDGRFRGQVVSPRTSIHAATMVKAGFTLKEALTAKLPGVKPSEVKTVVEEAMM